MSKKCLGCGVILQDMDANQDGYVEDMSHDICQRCFMIKNYGHNKSIDKTKVSCGNFILMLLKPRPPAGRLSEIDLCQSSILQS